MQGDLLGGFPEELNYEVLEVRKKKIWNEQNRMFDEIVLYCKTRGKDFKQSPACKYCVPPWEVCPNNCSNAL